MRTMLLLAASVVLCVLAPSPSAAHGAAKRKSPQLTVMTQNLYLGTDLVPVINALAVDPSSAPTVVAQAWSEVQTTNFPARAKLIAAEIAAAKPDIVALQEAVMWRSQPTSDVLTGTVVPNATHVEMDYVKILLKELRKKHRHYRIAALTVSIDVEAPYLHDGSQVGDLRMTDRDVVLVRTGVRSSKAATGNYTAALTLPILGGISVPRSYVAIDVKVGKSRLHVVATHLESDAEPVRAAQAQELVAGPAVSALPTIVLGDFNTDATLASPEPTYTTLVGALTEMWPVLHAGQPGLTWGQAPLLDNATSTATQRLDMVFLHGGLVPTSITVVGGAPADRVGGLWPSDHAGVVASVELE